MSKQWEGNWADEEPVMKKSCYESHPALKIGEYKLYGGSASHPIVSDADIYVSLQHGSTCDPNTDPWIENPKIEIHYPLSDGAAPKNRSRFRQMITWLCTQLQAGKKIHVGCIGGHGRTGVILSAIVAEMGEKDAVQYVRNHYCHKAVESNEQIRFLMEHYGVSKVSPSRDRNLLPNAYKRVDDYRVGGGKLVEDFSSAPAKLPGKSYAPMPSSRCIWKQKGA